MRVDASSGGAVSASKCLAISQTEAATEGDYSTFLFARTLLETRGSFRKFESWTKAASSGDSGIQVRSRRIAAEHTATLAKYEQLATHRFFLREGSVFRLQADGLKRVYQVEIGTLLWKFPSSLRVYAENVSSFRWIEELGPRGPWLVDRVIGARDFPTDMGGHEQGGDARGLRASGGCFSCRRSRYEIVRPYEEADARLDQRRSRS